MKEDMSTPIAYNTAIAELEKILATLRSDNCDVDSLTQLTRRATELLTVCRDRLTTTEAELQTILASLEAE